MIGEIIAGRYRLVEEVGAGGMARIYLAVDELTDQQCALKILREEYSGDREYIRQFKNEGAALQALNHPNIVKVYNVGKDHGRYYIAMEYVKGRTIKQMIQENGAFPVQEAVCLATDICHALQHAHDHSIIHRDIKPQNLLVREEDGVVKIMDFGIAAVESTRNPSVLSSGNVIGSVHYIAPEQACGDPTDKKTDIYSLGITLYEMLTARLPFDGDSTVAVAMKQVSEAVESPHEINPDIPVSLSDVVLKALSKDPEERYQQAMEFANDLNHAMEHPEERFVLLSDKPYVQKIKPPEKKPRDPNKNIHRLFIVLISAVVLITGVIIFARYLDNKIHASRVEVPNVIGKAETEGVEMITSAGLKYFVVYQYHDEVPEGDIFSTRPGVGKEAKKESTVRIYVSEGAEKVPVPGVVGLTPDAAATELTEAGFVVGSQQEGFDINYPNGVVIAQSVKEGDSAASGAAIDIIVNNLTLTGE